MIKVCANGHVHHRLVEYFHGKTNSPGVMQKQIDFITIATTGNSMNLVMRQMIFQDHQGCSNGHGGL